MAVTVSDVEELSSTSWEQFDQTKKQELLDMAETQADTIYSGRMSHTPTLEGDRDDFVRLLAAHLWTLANGGEAQSESSTGGSVTYNTVTGDPIDSLSETKWGRMAKEYIRSKQSIAIVRTR